MTFRNLVAGAVLLSAAAAWADEPAVIAPTPVKKFDPAAVAPDEPAVVAPAAVDSTVFPPEGPRMWANVEWLSWRMKDGPTPPLVSRGNSADARPGALGQAGTQVIYDGVDYDRQTGVRVAVGGWFRASDFGWEVGAMSFHAEDGDDYAAAGGDLYLPYTNAAAGPRGFVVSQPGLGLDGRVAVANEVRLWGLDGNGLLNLTGDDDATLAAVAGVRYLDLTETMTLGTWTDDLIFGGSFSAVDNFRTRNQFYGGQVGVQASAAQGRFFASLRGTVALGGTHQTRDFRGQAALTALPAGPFPHGVFVQQTNAGRETAAEFSVVPQVGLKVGVDVFPFLRLFAGYDVLYWTNVARPGDQIDTTLNFSQVLGGTLAGAARPAPVMQSSDYYAHGLTVGVQLRY